MDENPNGAEATNSDEELDPEEDLDDTEDVETLKQRLANAEKAKKQILARAKKAEAQLKTKATSDVTTEGSSKISVDDEYSELRLSGYTRDEARFIIANGGTKALEDKNSFVAIAINTRRDQARAEEEAAKAADTSGMSEIERKYSQEQLNNMSSAELEKILPHADAQ